MDDARFETIVVKQTKQSVLEEARQLANGKITAKRGGCRGWRTGSVLQRSSLALGSSSAFRFLRQCIARGCVLFLPRFRLVVVSVENGFGTVVDFTVCKTDCRTSFVPFNACRPIVNFRPPVSISFLFRYRRKSPIRNDKNSTDSQRVCPYRC